MTFQSNFGNCSSLKWAFLKQVKPLPFKHIVGDNQEEFLSSVIFWRNIIINLFRVLSSNLLRNQKIQKVSKVFCNQLFFKHKFNMCLNKIRLTRYLKDHVIHTPVPEQSPYNLVIVLDLISVSYNCLVAGALPEGLLLFWICPCTGCLECDLNSSSNTVFPDSQSNTLPMMLRFLSALMKTNSVTFKVLPGF